MLSQRSHRQQQSLRIIGHPRNDPGYPRASSKTAFIIQNITTTAKIGPGGLFLASVAIVTFVRIVKEDCCSHGISCLVAFL